MNKEKIFKAAKKFQVAGTLEDVEENTTGHINNTFFCYWNQHSNKPLKTVLQKINKNVFLEPLILDSNIRLVCEFLEHTDFTKDNSREIFRLIPMENGETLLSNEDGFWRMSQFIENCECVNKPRSLNEAKNIGSFLGSFHKYCDSFDVGKLGISIKGFQDVEGRFQAFREACKLDPVKRFSSVKAEVETLKSTSKFIEEYLEKFSNCPLRVTHGDPKYNNFFIKSGTDQPVSLIDLDTLMPGHVYYDVGDFIRGVSMKGDEDASEDSQRGIDLNIALAAFKGYIEKADFLKDLERESLVDSARLISTALGLRFLTDYILGDTYFRTSRERQNLDRARTQLALARDFKASREEFRALL